MEGEGREGAVRAKTNWRGGAGDDVPAEGRGGGKGIAMLSLLELAVIWKGSLLDATQQDLVPGLTQLAGDTGCAQTHYNLRAR